MASAFEPVEIAGLPPEVKDLGRPEAIHAAKSLLRTGLGVALVAGGVLLLGCGFAATYAYLNVPFPKDGPPAEIVLGVGVAAFVFGFGMIAVASRQPGGEGNTDAFGGYLVYPSALVRAKGGQCTIFSWDEVEALVNPETSLGDFQVRATDGRTMPVDRAIERYMELLGTILDRVKTARLEHARSEFAAGTTLPFGKFGVSREAIEYKGKTLRWDEMSVFEVVLHNGHRHLRVKKRGSLWPWCYAVLYGLPNEAIFFTLIEEARASRPRMWR